MTRKSKFRWGVNIDDVWKYAGLRIPKSVVIPYLLSVTLSQGKFVLPQVRRVVSDISGQSPAASGNEDTQRSASLLASFLKRNDVEFVRFWFQWNFFEKADSGGDSDSDSPSSNYVFPLDDFVSKLTEAGIEIIGAIGTGYKHFLPNRLNTDHLDEYVKRLSRSSAEIVRHYKDKVKIWQIENEPNWWRAHYLGHWRRGIIWLNTENQAPIIRALYSTVRSECPDSTIVINLEADDGHADWKFYSKYCDILGLDFYPNYSHSYPSDGSLIAKRASQVRKETGLPVLVIETGYPTGPRFLGYNEARQSAYIRSACEAAFACDAISSLGWFKFSDSYWRSFPYHENHFGLLTKDGRAKLGWEEYVCQIREK